MTVHAAQYSAVEVTDNRHLHHGRVIEQCCILDKMWLSHLMRGILWQFAVLFNDIHEFFYEIHICSQPVQSIWYGLKHAVNCKQRTMVQIL